MLIIKNILYVFKTRYNITGIIHNWSNKSKRFAIEFSTIKDGIPTLFELLNNKLLEAGIVDLEKSFNKSAGSYLSKSILRNVLVALYNLSYLEYRFQAVWRDAHAFFSLMAVARFASSFHALASFKLVSLLTVANVFQDTHVSENLTDFKVVIHDLVEILVKCCHNFNNKMFQLKMNVYEGEEQVFDITYTDEYDAKWNYIEVASAIYRLTVNDSLKQFVYFDYPTKKCLKETILKGNEVEKEFALKLLWQLCFNREIAEDFLKTEASLLQSLRTLLVENRVRVENKRLLVIINNFMQYLKTELHTDLYELRNKAALNLHVIISYHRDELELASRLKGELERQNFKGWAFMDKNLNLATSLNAIENSRRMIMLMSERYKQDNNCRSEAEHAYKLGKHVIPVVAQTGYVPSGWLANLTASSFTIDGTGVHVDECVKRVIKAISENYVAAPYSFEAYNNSRVHMNGIFPSLTERRDKTVLTVMDYNNAQPIRSLKWTEWQVRQWAIEKKFNQKLVESIMPCDGKVLEQYYMMMRNVPEFFFNSLNTKGLVSLRDSGYFASELKKLFE